MNKKTYYVTMTYINTIEASSFEEAEKLTIESILNGDIAPNDIETEVEDSELGSFYEYDNEIFKDKHTLIEKLIKDGVIDSFKNWVNDEYSAYDVLCLNTYDDNVEDKYEIYKEEMFEWCIEVEKVKIK